MLEKIPAVRFDEAKRLVAEEIWQTDQKPV